ncbi:MAG: ribosomal RNA small subunit methyltransferase A [Candidatus Lokiarchaeota archaeon]|nr:ribosomal RNA small subunit methyltransferase A [Candidatus Lokiarchaeota archaeon]
MEIAYFLTDLKTETLDILKKYNLTPKKYFSQNFVINSALNNLHIKNLDLKDDDEIIEIGGGLGFLTKDIAEKVSKIITLEIDINMAKILRTRLKDYSNVEIIEIDALKIDSNLFENRKIVSNTPYSISSVLLFKILEARNYICSSLSFQKEFAERLIAQPNTSKYGKISLTSKIFSKIELVDYIPKNYFYPIPKVDSAVVKILPRSEIECDNLTFLLKFIREIFNYRNKILKNGVRYFLKKENISLDMNKLEADNSLILERKILTLSLEEIILFTKELRKINNFGQYFEGIKL